MVGIVKAGFNWLYNKIPLAGTTDRIIFNLYISTYISTGLSNFFVPSPGKNQARDLATFAVLGLHGRLTQVNNEFIQLIENPLPLKDATQEDTTPAITQEAIEQAKNAPLYTLLKLQLNDLINKVIIAAAFYATKDIFYSSFKHLLSHSEKVSKIAQPILDRVSSLPIPRLLQSARVVAFAPVIAKLIHMALIYADPKGEFKVLEALKIGANRTSQGLEFLWNLRFSLLCLGLSKTVYSSVVLTIYSQLVNRLIADKGEVQVPRSDIKVPLSSIKGALSKLPGLIPQSSSAAPTAWNQFLIFFGDNDSWPTTGFALGFDGMLASWRTSSAPYNIAILERLFNEANNLKMDIGNDGPAVFLEQSQSAITTIKAQIALALNEGKISEAHASNLYELVDLKTQKSLADLVLNPEFEGLFDDDDFLALFKTLYCQKHSEDQATKFIGFLKKLNKFKAPEEFLNGSEQIYSIINEKKKFLKSESITPSQEQACKWILFKKIEQSFNEIIIPSLSNKGIDEIYQQLSDVNEYLNFCTVSLRNCHAEVSALRSKISKKIVSEFQFDFKMDTLFEKNGILDHLFTVNQEDRFSIYLVSAKFLLSQFELDLQEYLANPPTKRKEKEQVENNLYWQGLKAQLDYQLIASSSGFTQWISNQPPDSAILSQDSAEQAKAYVMKSNLFNFTRRFDLKTLDGFKFKIENLSNLVEEKYGFSSGANGILANLQPSSVSCATLEELSNEANALKEDPDSDGPVAFLVKFQSLIETIKSKIALALQEGKISEAHASSLHESVDLKTQKSLAGLVLYPQLENLLDDDNFLALFKTIYCQNRSKDQATEFTAFFKELSQLQVHTKDFFKRKKSFDASSQFNHIITKMNRLLDSESITPSQEQACKQVLFKKVEQSFNNVIIPTLFTEYAREIPQRLSDADAYLSFCARMLGNCAVEVNALRSKILKEAVGKFFPNIKMNDLLNERYEKNMVATFGKDGIIHKFAVTKEDQFSAYLASAKFFLNRFDFNLQWYLNNPPIKAQECKEIELLLLHLTHQAELNYQLIANSSQFTNWANSPKKGSNPIEIDWQAEEKASQLKHGGINSPLPPEELVKAYVQESELFNFTRTSLAIPDDFEFEVPELGRRISGWKGYATPPNNDPMQSMTTSKEANKLTIIELSPDDSDSSDDDVQSKTPVNNDSLAVMNLLQKNYGMYCMLGDKVYYDKKFFISSKSIQALKNSHLP